MENGMENGMKNGMGGMVGKNPSLEGVYSIPNFHTNLKKLFFKKSEKSNDE